MEAVTAIGLPILSYPGISWARVLSGRDWQDRRIKTKLIRQPWWKTLHFSALVLELKCQFCLSLEQISAKSGEFGVKGASELHFLLLINCCSVFSFKLYLVKGKKLTKLGWIKARQKTGHLSLSLLYGILKFPSEHNRWYFLWSIFRVGVFAQ